MSTTGPETPQRGDPTSEPTTEPTEEVVDMDEVTKQETEDSEDDNNQ